MIKVSIIVPVYKTENSLNRCVESLVGQSYQNLEIILVDDGSPDSCPKMCDNWAQKDNRIKVIHKQNGGVSSARNIGIENATGDYITFVDSDDYINDNFSVICGRVNEENPEFAVVPINKLNEEFEIDLTESEFCKIIRDKSLYITSTWSKFIRKDKIVNTKFKEGMTIGEDKEFIIRVLLKCDKIKIYNDPFYKYCDNPESCMNNNGFKIINKMIDSSIMFVNEVNNYNVSQTLKNDILETASSGLFMLLAQYKFCSKEEKKTVKLKIKRNIGLFSYAKKRGEKLLYNLMRIFGFSFVANLKLFNLFIKLKIV